MTRISSCKLLIITLSFLLLVNTLAWSEGIWDSPWFPVTPYSGWSFNDVYFVEPGQGWMVGVTTVEGTGFIAHTDGNGWKPQLYSLHLVPVSVQFLTATKGWVAGYRWIENKKREGVLLYTEDGGKHWRERHRFPWALYNMQFVTEHKGWAAGYARGADDKYNGVILTTDDGGEHWRPQYEGLNEALYGDLCFTDVKSGWVLGWSQEQKKSILLHTTDGGKNWTHMSLDEKTIQAIDFISTKEGWAIGGKSVVDESQAAGGFNVHWTVFHTQDGGQTWTEQKAGTEKSLSMLNPTIFFVNENEGWVTVDGIILHTEDGGKRWTAQKYKLVGPDKLEREIWTGGMYFLDEKWGWIVGKGILSTKDGGMSWLQEPQMPFGNLSLNKIVFVTSKKGWVVGEDGTIFHTADGGLTWQRQGSSTSVELLGAHFVNSQEGWVVGDEGTILHTTSGGNTWVRQKSGTESSLKDVQFIDAQEGWIVGDIYLPEQKTWEGIILHTVNSGKKWETVENVPVNLWWLSDVHFVDAQTGWIVGLATILHTDDGGKSWQEQRSADIDSRLVAVYFLDSLTGWMISWYDIAHTVDGGHTWKVQYNTGKETRLKTLYFASRQEGWAVGQRGTTLNTILHTTDGGQTWSYQQSLGHHGAELRSICYGGKNTLWAVGEYGTLLKYYEPNLRVIEPSYWAVEQLGKDTLSWGELKQLEQSSMATAPVLTDQLYQNYPNPFNPETWIPYQLASDADVTINIYNITGQIVRTLHLGHQRSGVYITKEQAAYWDGRDNLGRPVASGVYYYTMLADEFKDVKKMVILR